MNIIKNFRGIKIVVLVLLVVTNFVMLSCSEDELPSEYKIVFKNNYFEVVNVEIDTIKIPKLLPNEISKPIFMQKGIYQIQCITKSNLLIKSKLDLKGQNEQVTIFLNKKGKILLFN